VNFTRSSIAAILIGFSLLVPAGTAAAGPVRSVVAFHPAVGEFPEGIAADKTGRLYVSMFVLDQVRRLDRGGAQTIVARLPHGAAPAGIKLDASGTLYVAASGFNLATGRTDPTTRGVYRMRRGGAPERIAGTDAILFPNDLALDHRGNLYVTDATGGAVWRVDGRGGVERWSTSPLLRGTGQLLGFPYGANGIAFSRGHLLVSNTERGSLVTIPIDSAGEAGAPSVLTESPSLLGVDGIALDVRGTVYAAINGQDKLVAVRSGGAIDALATASDGLNQPSSVAFGTGNGGRRTLFLVNFAVGSTSPPPGVLSLTVGVPGRPLP
jgi:sugar lactone lactonase YvrE